MTEALAKLDKAHTSIGIGGAMVSSIEDLWRMAGLIARSGFAPKGMSQEAVSAAILWGYELGISPMSAVQNIAVINGRPCLWGDIVKARVLQSGHAEYIRETIEGDGEAMAATCESKRKDSPHPHVTRFSVADAKRAGLWGKQGPWTQYPRRMLAMRARSWNLRDNFADVLKGVAIREEVQDYVVTSKPESTVQAANPYRELPPAVEPEQQQTPAESAQATDRQADDGVSIADVGE